MALRAARAASIGSPRPRARPVARPCRSPLGRRRGSRARRPAPARPCACRRESALDRSRRARSGRRRGSPRSARSPRPRSARGHLGPRGEVPSHGPRGRAPRSGPGPPRASARHRSRRRSRSRSPRSRRADDERSSITASQSGLAKPGSSPWRGRRRRRRRGRRDRTRAAHRPRDSLGGARRAGVTSIRTVGRPRCPATPASQSSRRRECSPGSAEPAPRSIDLPTPLRSSRRRGPGNGSTLNRSQATPPTSTSSPQRLELASDREGADDVSAAADADQQSTVNVL